MSTTTKAPTATTTYTIDGQTYLLTINVHNRTGLRTARDYKRKDTVDVDASILDHLVPAQPCYEDFTELGFTHTGTAYTERGKYPAIDRAWDKHNRALLKVQKAVAIEGLKALGWEYPEGLKYRRTAGCSCGCSPAWVLITNTHRYVWMSLKAV